MRLQIADESNIVLPQSRLGVLQSLPTTRYSTSYPIRSVGLRRRTVVRGTAIDSWHLNASPQLLPIHTHHSSFFEHSNQMLIWVIVNSTILSPMPCRSWVPRLCQICMFIRVIVGQFVRLFADLFARSYALVLSYVYDSKHPIFGLTQEWFRELSFSRLECGVHDRLHIYPLCGIFYFHWHRHQIEGTDGV